MSNVISLVDIRNGRIKETLLSYACTGAPVILETRTGLVSAEKIICRAAFAEIFNSHGDYFIVEYSIIRDIHPVSAVQTSAVNAAGDWVVAHDRMPRGSASSVVNFPGRARRR